MSGKDYYEVLGIRPNAGSEEIELAYKGRRSQYHPDRYAQGDADTQAWATAKMQEVNEAYRALSDADQRAAHDRSRRSAAEPPPRPSQGGSAPPQSRSPAESLLRPDWGWNFEHVHIRPRIPRRKLEGAIAAYAPTVPPEAVLLLIDDTVFGGAADGMMVTTQGIHSKQMMDSPRYLAWESIRTVEPGPKGRVMVNGYEFFRGHIVDHYALVTLARRLAIMVGAASAPRPQQPSPGRDHGARDHAAHGDPGTRGTGVESLLALHRRAMAGLDRETEGNTFMLGELIDRQVASIARIYPAIRSGIVNSPEAANWRGTVDSNSASVALMLLATLHYFGLSRYTDELNYWTEGEIDTLYGVGLMYVEQFRDGFEGVFGTPMELDDETMTVMCAMFMHQDGASDFDLRIPRDQALVKLAAEYGVPAGTMNVLMQQIAKHTEAWFREFVAILESEGARVDGQG